MNFLRGGGIGQRERRGEKRAKPQMFELV